MIYCKCNFLLNTLNNKHVLFARRVLTCISPPNSVCRELSVLCACAVESSSVSNSLYLSVSSIIAGNGLCLNCIFFYSITIYPAHGKVGGGNCWSLHRNLVERLFIINILYIHNYICFFFVLANYTLGS